MDWLLSDDSGHVTRQQAAEILEGIRAFQMQRPHEGGTFWIFLRPGERQALLSDHVLAALERGETIRVKEMVWDEDLVVRRRAQVRLLSSFDDLQRLAVERVQHFIGELSAE